MVMNSNRKDSFRALLTNHIIVEDFLDFCRAGNALDRPDDIIFLHFLGDDVIAQGNTLVADVNVRTGNQFFTSRWLLPQKLQ